MCFHSDVVRSTWSPLVFCRGAFPCRSLPHPFARRGLPTSDSPAIFRSPVAELLHVLISNHVVHGRIIFPGAAYLETARAAARTALRGVFFLQPLAIEAPGLLLVECAVLHGRFEVRSSDATEAVTVHCSGATGGDTAWQRILHSSLRTPSRAADVAALYDSFHAIG